MNDKDPLPQNIGSPADPDIKTRNDFAPPLKNNNPIPQLPPRPRPTTSDKKSGR